MKIGLLLGQRLCAFVCFCTCLQRFWRSLLELAILTVKLDFNPPSLSHFFTTCSKDRRFQLLFVNCGSAIHVCTWFWLNFEVSFFDTVRIVPFSDVECSSVVFINYLFVTILVPPGAPTQGILLSTSFARRLNESTSVFDNHSGLNILVQLLPHWSICRIIRNLSYKM